MNKVKKCKHILILFFLWLPFGVEGRDLDKDFERILRANKLNKDHVGWYVYNLDKNQPVSAWKENQAFIPASLSKLLTASAVLKMLPNDKVFKTQLLASGAREGGTLKGALVLKGGGDPGFTSEGMWVLVNHFVRSGIKKVEGGIVVDESRFEGPYFSSTRQAQRVDRAYDAPVGAMSFNWNSLNIYVRPGPKVGAPAEVFVDPPSEYIELVSNVTTSGARSSDQIQFKFSSRGAGKEHLVVSGSFPLGRDEKVYYRSVQDPAYWSGYQLKSFLSQRGIEVSGEIRKGGAPAGARLVAEHESRPLPLLVYDMQKWSNNYVAEMLIKNLSAELGGGKGSLEDGMAKARAHFMSTKGWEGSSFSFTNPSGLTRDNKFTPVQIHQVLKDKRDDFSNFAEFLFALPVGGLDGTLKSRMSGERSRVRAKTGMLNGVVGLAGYVQSPDNDLLSFTLMYNGSSAYSNVWRAFDQMAVHLSK